MMSLVVPVYRNEENIPPLLAALDALAESMSGELEVVFVVDGSPDESLALLRSSLPSCRFDYQILGLSRNFGSFSAVRAGMEVGAGPFYAVMAADLQEPPDLIREFRDALSGGHFDVAIGVRAARVDPALTALGARLFWGFFRRFVLRDVPSGGVDVFGCTKPVRDHLLAMRESNSSLVGLLFWVGFRRKCIPYLRREREIGSSAWTMSKKLRYLTDSIYGFSDLPIRILTRAGLVGMIMSMLFGAVVLVARISGAIEVPGYAATVFTIAFLGALNCLGLGIIGNYVWRTFENTKGRPAYIVASRVRRDGKEVDNVES